MAWYFGLAVECGPNPADADAVVAVFQGSAVRLSTGEDIKLRAFRHANPDSDGSWWCAADPYADSGVSIFGIGSEADAQTMGELGFRLYDRLRRATTYRDAIAGIEVFDFCTFDQLLDDDGSWLSLLHGLVLSDDTWRRLAAPPAVVPFAPGYVWTPYRGELFGGRYYGAPSQPEARGS
jgi:hypothetical protein